MTAWLESRLVDIMRTAGHQVTVGFNLPSCGMRGSVTCDCYFPSVSWDTYGPIKYNKSERGELLTSYGKRNPHVLLSRVMDDEGPLNEADLPTFGRDAEGAKS